jgi:P63C domain
MDPQDGEIQGKAKGGFARAEVLTATERKQIASKAAKVRWGDGLPQAIREGKLTLLGRTIPCAVIEGETRILNQAGFLRAIGRARSPKAGTGIQSTVDDLPFFLQAKALRPFISEELAVSTKPISYKVESGAVETGYDARLLPQVADVYLKYRDDCLRNGKPIPTNYSHIIETCDILMRSLAGVAIIALVDEASGYQEIRPQDALQAYLEKLVAKELAAWVKKFPDEFYENIYKLKGWTWPGMKKNRYSVVSHYTRDLVYERLAPGLLRKLEEEAPKTDNGNRKGKLHQLLTDDIGNPLLSQHMHSLVMFQRLAIASGFGWNRYVKMVDQAMPKRGNTLSLPFPEGVSEAPITEED